MKNLSFNIFSTSKILEYWSVSVSISVVLFLSHYLFFFPTIMSIVVWSFLSALVISASFTSLNTEHREETEKIVHGAKLMPILHVQLVLCTISTMHNGCTRSYMQLLYSYCTSIFTLNFMLQYSINYITLYIVCSDIRALCIDNTDFTHV